MESIANGTGRPQCPSCGRVMPPGRPLETHLRNYCDGGER